MRRRPDLKLPDISGQFRHLDGNEQALTVIESVEIQAMDPAITVTSLMTYTVASGQTQHKSRLKSDLNREIDDTDLRNSGTVCTLCKSAMGPNTETRRRKLELRVTSGRHGSPLGDLAHTFQQSIVIFRHLPRNTGKSQGLFVHKAWINRD